MHTVNVMKVRVGITVERMNHEPVARCLKAVGMNYSQFCNAVTGMLAYRLRGCSTGSDEKSLQEIKQLIDDFMNYSRGKCDDVLIV